MNFSKFLLQTISHYKHLTREILFKLYERSTIKAIIDILIDPSIFTFCVSRDLRVNWILKSKIIRKKLHFLCIRHEKKEFIRVEMFVVIFQIIFKKAQHCCFFSLFYWKQCNLKSHTVYLLIINFLNSIKMILFRYKKIELMLVGIRLHGYTFLHLQIFVWNYNWLIK